MSSDLTFLDRGQEDKSGGRKYPYLSTYFGLSSLCLPTVTHLVRLCGHIGNIQDATFETGGTSRGGVGSRAGVFGVSSGRITE